MKPHDSLLEKHALITILFIVFGMSFLLMTPWAVGFKQALMTPTSKIYLSGGAIFFGLVVLALVWALRKGLADNGQN